MFQQECQRVQCSGEHLFCLTPFGSILCGKESNGTAMRGRNPVMQGTFKGEESALAFQFFDVYKIPGEGSGKTVEDRRG